MRVLYVATDLRDADILQQEVKRAAPKLVLDVCAGSAEARARAERSLGYDVMLLDSSVPESEQLLLIQHVRTKQIPLPIALLASQNAAPSSALVSAADECITRGPRLAERLQPGLRMAIERYRIVATTLKDNERLKRSEARLRLIIEALPAGVVLVDQAGKILAMNLAGSTLVGTGGPVRRRRPRDLFAGRCRRRAASARAGRRARSPASAAAPSSCVTVRTARRDRSRSRRCASSATRPAARARSWACCRRRRTRPPATTPASSSPSPARMWRRSPTSARRSSRRSRRCAPTSSGSSTKPIPSAGGCSSCSPSSSARGPPPPSITRNAPRSTSSRAVRRRASRSSKRKQREEQAAMEAVVSRAGSLTDEATSLRQERQRLAHEADALKQELLDQRRSRLELEERIAAADVERERLTDGAGVGADRRPRRASRSSTRSSARSRRRLPRPRRASGRSSPSSTPPSSKPRVCTTI